MPSLGHVAVGLAAGRFHGGDGRLRAAPTLALTALALFPDIDVLARELGAVRGSPWLHRGALHSLPVAIAAGVLAALVLGGLGRTRWRMAATAVLAAASHGLLDACTYGGRGAMLLWPFSEARFAAPWHVLVAAPIGWSLVSARGVALLLREALLFSPLLVYALWPAQRPLAPAASRDEPG